MNKQRSYTLLMLVLLLGVLVVLFSPILFTTKIVRAPDILNEFYWGVYNAYGKPIWSLLRIDLSSAGWNPYINSGHTNDGGMVSMQFLYLYRLIFGLIPAPASVAWFMVLHLFLGGAGTYLYCRLVGCSRLGSLLGGLIFAFCTENASLINAGHVMKIATIAHAPWVFYFLEKGFRTNRWFPYLCAGMVLTFQFFNTHWQIAFYTCLGVAVYGIMRLLEELYAGEPFWKTGRTLMMGTIMVLFFLLASAISLAPLVGWSKDTNRGAHSGANQGKGGLDREEAMMWSLPPEETVALVIPGLFGLSRQEGGDQPKPDQTYYWGRMVFTQTASYFGLLPWLLLPLPFLFKNDRVTKAALVAVFGGILFSMGKYTPFYQFLYDYLPGISRFRVPKMMLFMTAFGLAVLAARGVDLLRENQIQDSPQLRKWMLWVLAFPLVLTLLLGVEKLFGSIVREWLFELLSRPTRYQSGIGLITQRWINFERETGIALALASLSALVLLGMARHKLAAGLGAGLLLLILIGDLWRVNQPFLTLTDPPNRTASATTPPMNWIKAQDPRVGGILPEYRALLLGNADAMGYVAARIPVLFTANAVQKRRWQEYLDAFSLQSSMPDLMNVRWLVYDEQLYTRDKQYFGDRYLPLFKGGGEVVLENRQVLPKAWLVSSTQVVSDPVQRLKILQSAEFNPRTTALVEVAPPLPLANGGLGSNVVLRQYQDEKIELQTLSEGNCLLVLGEKYQNGWKATVDGKQQSIVPVDHILRGVYLTPGRHLVEFRFDPLPFKIGKWLTQLSFGLFWIVALRELFLRKENHAD
jgi:hypothetical protein